MVGYGYGFNHYNHKNHNHNNHNHHNQVIYGYGYFEPWLGQAPQL